MTTEAKIQLTATELGSLWMIYQSSSALVTLFALLKDKTIEKEAQNILNSYITEVQNVKDEIKNVFNNENAVIPIAFDEHDVVKDAPPLFDDIFNIMFLRQMMKFNYSASATFSSMSYMKEVQDIFKLNYDISNKYYVMTTNYLLGKGVLSRPPYATMPKQVEFIDKISYMSGKNPFLERRSLNTIEVGFLNEGIEDNIFGMQLMTGFAQIAKGKEVKEYFIEGKELAKKIITEVSSMLLKSDIQPPSTWAGKATNSTAPIFTDKIMMYITSLISSAALRFNALGTSFSLRSDLHTKFALISKNIFDFSKKGGKVMIENKWMEEPPQMEDRNQLTR